MTWMKNGEEIVQEIDYGDILPSGDGTYQTWASVELDPQSSNLYSCHVEHCGVHMVLQVPQGKDGDRGCPGREPGERGEQETMLAAREGRIDHCLTQCALEWVF